MHWLHILLNKRDYFFYTRQWQRQLAGQPTSEIKRKTIEHISIIRREHEEEEEEGATMAEDRMNVCSACDGIATQTR